MLPPLVKSHFNKRCVGVEAGAASSGQSGQVRLRFSDGSTHETNIVLGADGIKSVIREQGAHTFVHMVCGVLNVADG